MGITEVQETETSVNELLNNFSNNYPIYGTVLISYLIYFQPLQLLSFLMFKRSLFQQVKWSWLPHPFNITSVIFDSLCSRMQDVPGSSCTFPTPHLELDVSPKSTGLFYWEMVFREYVWMLVVLIATGLVAFSRPFQRTDLGNMCVCV